MVLFLKGISHSISLFIMTAAFFSIYSQSSQDCINYLINLHNESSLNPAQFLHNMTPYLVLSGKSIDDLGFPGSCEEDQQKYKYFTVEVTIQTNTTEYTGYLGFCFTNICTAQDLNAYAEFIIDFIFQQYTSGVSGKFIDPQLQLQFSPNAFFICMLFLTAIILSMLDPISRWLRMCKQPMQSEYQIKSLYIDLENPSSQLDEDRVTPQSSKLQKISLYYKWKQLWKQENTYQIWSFSLFRVIAAPFLIYSQIFWLTNYGAYNYYAFYEEIYQQFYVKIAMFGYYLPDIFFFISAFLFSKKIISFQDDVYSNLFKSIGWKILRLYPLYIIVFIIYWGISPALHSGPIWYIYEQEASVCSTSWWKVILMIDNWFKEGCYPALWFVQVQIQLTLTASILFFSIYLKNKKIGLWVFGVLYIASFVLLFVFDGQMLVSVQVAIDPYTQLYFKSYYSHIWFYLTGVLFAILADKQSLRIGLQEKVLDNVYFNMFLKLFASSILVLILLRPWVWIGHTELSLELTFCRVGTLLCFLILFLNGMFVKESSSTVIHKYAYYMYPVILVSYMVASSSFWSSGSFMYVSGYDILNEMIPNFLISYALGIFLGILFDWRNLVIS